MSKKGKIKANIPQKKQEIKEDVSQNKTSSTNNTFAFKRENYKLLLIGLAFIIVGFLLMIGGGSSDPDVYNPDIFSFRRLTLAPILILAGYVIEIFAIMKRPKTEE